MDANCPYCDAELEINHDDGYGYSEDGKHEQECRECEKTFTYITSILYCYETEKADCLNGGEHRYEKTHTYPTEFSKMRCLMCDKEREMTEEERVDFKIGTKESFFGKLK
jgi:hypothetical protein